MPVSRMPFSRRWFVAGFACLALAMMPTIASAALVWDVSLDTSALAAAPGSGPYALAFTLLPGTTTGNTTVTLSNFQFGSGGPSGSPTLTGGASGNLASTVILTTSTFFNDFVQDFTPGATLSFHIVLDSLTTAQPPDSFTFSILDKTGYPIPTLDPSGVDSLLSLETGSPVNPVPLVATFASDPGKTPLKLDPPVVTNAIPEPSSIVSALAGALLLSGWRWRSSARKPHRQNSIN